MFALVLVLSANAEAGRVERLNEEDRLVAAVAIPGSEEGRWRTRAQLVWDSVQGRLARRVYRVWDPFPSLDLELLWRSEDTHSDRSGPVEGVGRVEWRRRGAPTYDPAGLVAVYSGRMHKGRSHGEGTYQHSSGLAYQGEWRDGLMHGQGRLQLPDGDEYVGGFLDGRRHGHGLYVDSRGVAYDGGFAGGKREGEGTVTLANAQSYRARFRAGSEITGTRASLPPVGRGRLVAVSRYRSYDDLRLGVIVDRRPAIAYADQKPMHYTSQSDGEVLRVFPNHPRFMDVWKGRTEIQLTQDEEFYHVVGSRVLGTDFRFEPVPLIFELENRSPQTLRILEAFLDVAASQTEIEPFIQLSAGDYNECSGLDLSFNSFLRLENYGWASAEAARISFQFTDADGGRSVPGGSRELGRIDKVIEVDLTDELKRAGVNVDLTASRDFQCSSDNDGQCIGEISSTGALGSLDHLVWRNGVYVHVNAKGTLEYDWRDTEGTMHHKASRFTARLLVARIYSDVECGESGNPTSIRHEPFKLQLDRKDYRIPVQLRDDIPAGITGRWRVKLEADKSSNHSFRFVMRLADGREVASRPIRMLFARPAIEPTGDARSGPWR